MKAIIVICTIIMMILMSGCTEQNQASKQNPSIVYTDDAYRDGKIIIKEVCLNGIVYYIYVSGRDTHRGGLAVKYNHIGQLEQCN